MYHVSAQGIDERMINVHYYYYAAPEEKRKKKKKKKIVTKLCLSSHFCSSFFVAKKRKKERVLSAIKYICRDKHTSVGTKTVFCRDKCVFVSTIFCLFFGSSRQ